MVSFFLPTAFSKLASLDQSDNFENMIVLQDLSYLLTLSSWLFQQKIEKKTFELFQKVGFSRMINRDSLYLYFEPVYTKQREKKRENRR